MSWHFLQGQEEASWEGPSLDGAPSALLSLMPTRGKSCSIASVTAYSHASPSGATSEPLTDTPGAGTLMSSLEASPARTSPWPEPSAEGSRARALGYGGKWRESLARWDQSSCSWKTCPLFSGLTLEPSLEIWPRWGSMQNGELYRRGPWALGTSGNDYGLLPTPVASEGLHGHQVSAEYVEKRRRQRRGIKLGQWLFHHGREDLARSASFREWMMGYPIGWTDLEPLATDRFQQWLQQHGGR